MTRSWKYHELWELVYNPDDFLLHLQLQSESDTLTHSMKSPVMFSLSSILVFCFGWLTYAATVTYDFNITWVTANPDGLFERSVIGINGQWPIPYITATVGDRIVVNVQNQLGNESTSLHFHGMYQNGSTEMDGTVGATQCPIKPGASFTYNFTVSPSSLILYADTNILVD